MYEVWSADLYCKKLSLKKVGTYPCASDAIKAMADVFSIRAEVRRVTDIEGNPITPRVIATYNH